MVEGLSGVLPVSAAAHLILVPRSLGWGEPAFGSTAFAAATQLGLLIGILVGVRGDLPRILGPDRRLAWALLVAVIPGVILGVFGAGFFDPFFRQRSAVYVGATLAAGAAWLWLGERQGRQVRDVTQMRRCDGLIIGLVQALAPMPGLGLTGTTIAVGQLLGLKRDSAGRFALLLAVPVLAGAVVARVPELAASGTPPGTAGLLVAGLLASAAAAFLATAGLLAWLRRWSTDLFVVYRLGFAAAIVVALLSR